MAAEQRHGLERDDDGGHKRPFVEVFGPDAVASPQRHGAGRPIGATRGSAAVDRALETVESVLGQHGTVACSGECTLEDVADVIIMRDRTAAAIVDINGELLGALTENDLVHAYLLGVSSHSTAGAWLQTPFARLPKEDLGGHTVKPATSLLEAAALMRAQVNAENPLRHLVVRDGDSALLGILSSLDLARALGGACVGQRVLGGVGCATAVEAMKPKGALPVCCSSATLAHVLSQMVTSRQNCVVVADWDLRRSSTLGIVTPRDAVRAFDEHVPLSTLVGHWLRGLQSEWEPRIVPPSMPLHECAAKMALESVHHLVVVSPQTYDIEGVISSTDLAQIIGSTGQVEAPMSR